MDKQSKIKEIVKIVLITIVAIGFLNMAAVSIMSSGSAEKDSPEAVLEVAFSE